MDTKELLKKVRRIEIKTKGLSNHLFSGEYHTVFKGRGMSFSEVREYQFGDDVRAIDWNVTARFNHPYIKVFEEERELTMMLMVDVSRSSVFGTHQQFKNEMITELCAVLAFSASTNNDKVGVIFFSDRVEKFIPPKKGRMHILRIIRELIEFEPEHTGTDITEALRYLNNIMKKKAITFLISDYLNKGYDKALSIACKRHDVIGIRVVDELDKKLPRAGLMRVQHAETGAVEWLDTASKGVRNAYAEHFRVFDKYYQSSFRKSGADVMQDIYPGKPYVKALLQFFKSRGARR